MKTSDFDYPLSEEQIAYRPLKQRQNSKLMVLRREDRSIQEKHFYDLPEFLHPGDLLVFNNTKVIPGRLFGRRESGAETEVLLIERIEDNRWSCLARKPKEGLTLTFEEGLTGELCSTDGGEWVIQFSRDVGPYLESSGKMPLPPYIKRDADEEDKITYQTVYAEKYGAAAAPTAGLHFTKELIEEIKNKGVQTAEVTLHVGLGTFLPVKEEDISKHHMHSEYIEVPGAVAALVNKAKVEKRRVIAVGTTVVRTLESYVDSSGQLEAGSGRTELFITPGFEFKIVDAMITNFHQPCSTLLMLVSAFAEREYIMEAYGHALRSGYRFLSYGDSMLIS